MSEPVTSRDELVQLLRHRLKAVFPPVVSQLIQESLQEEPDFKNIGRIIGMDPALTATILSLVNSPYYGLSREVIDLERAAVVLGNREILKIALSVSFQGKVSEHLGNCGASVKDNWSLLIWAAMASQLIARKISPAKAEHCYLCTLLKDISLLMICASRPELLPRYTGNEIFLCLHPGQLEMERKAWGIDHCRLSAELLDAWDVPADLCAGIVHHHDFEHVQDHDLFTRAIILGTKWSEVELLSSTDPGMLIQFKSHLGKVLGVSDEELDDLRSQCINEYKLLTQTLKKEFRKEAQGQETIVDLPLETIQTLYLLSLDLSNVKGGITAVVSTLGKHLRWHFHILEWELALLGPSSTWVQFQGKNGKMRKIGEHKLLQELTWQKGEKRFPIRSSGKVFGQIGIKGDLDPGLKKELELYARLIGISYEHYVRSQAVLELKAQTLDKLPLGVGWLSPHGNIVDTNERMQEFLAGSDLKGGEFWDFLSQAKGISKDPEWKTFLGSDIHFYNRVFCPLGPSTEDEHACFYLSAHKSEVEGVTGILVLVEDISEITDLQYKAIKQREYLENLIRSMQDLVMTVDSEGIITFASFQFAEQLEGRNFFQISKPMGIFIDQWGPEIMHHEAPIQVSLQMGKELIKPFEVVFTPLKSEADSYMIVGRDMSMIMRLEEKIKRQAIYDHLTNVFNRHQFQIFLDREVERSHRSGHGLGLIFFDVDNLKTLNDRKGHAAGDAILKDIGRILRQCFRKGMDFPCRYGGDEFAILTTGLKSNKMLHILGERLHERMRNHFKDLVSISIGAAILRKEESGEELINRADNAAYQSKIHGGNQITWSD